MEQQYDTAQNRLKLMVGGVLLALIGAAFSAYSTWHHIAVKSSGSTDFSCNINATVSCDAVAQSAYSEVFGLPLGVWGIGYFLGLILCLIVPKFVPKNEEDCLLGYAASVVIGVLSSIVLFCISAFAVGSICLACSGVYVVTIAQAGLLFCFKGSLPAKRDFQSISNGGLVALVGVVATVVSFQFIGPRFNRVAQQDLPMAGPDGKPLTLVPIGKEIVINRSQYSGLGEDFRKGAESARVTIIEFADFQCPACAQAAQLVDAVAKRFGERVQVVFKNYPLDQACNGGLRQQIHPKACAAAAAARCAGEFDKFWPYHDLLFQNQRNLNDQSFVGWATVVGIPREEFKECLESSESLAKIKDDIAQGNEVGVTGTPTIFINNQKYVGERSVESMSTVIGDLLN